MDGTSVLYDFIMYFLEPFADHMSDSSFEIMLSTVGSGFLMMNKCPKMYEIRQ